MATTSPKTENRLLLWECTRMAPVRVIFWYRSNNSAHSHEKAARARKLSVRRGYGNQEDPFSVQACPWHKSPDLRRSPLYCRPSTPDDGRPPQVVSSETPSFVVYVPGILCHGQRGRKRPCVCAVLETSSSVGLIAEPTARCPCDYR